MPPISRVGFRKLCCTLVAGIGGIMATVEDRVYEQLRQLVLHEARRLIVRIKNGQVNYFGFDRIIEIFLNDPKFVEHRAQLKTDARELLDQENLTHKRG